MNESTSGKLDTTRRQFPDLPQAITSFGAAVLGDRLYIYGGHHGQPHHYSQAGQSGILWRLNLKKRTQWEQVSIGPKLTGLAMVAHGEMLYRLGGFTAHNTVDKDQDLWSVADFARFDPQKGKWESLPPMPQPRSSFDACVAGDTLYVVGGWALQGDQETEWHGTAWLVDLSQQPICWKPLPNPPFQRRALSVGALDGRIHVIGGMQPSGEATTGTAVFDVAEGRWSEGADLPGDAMEGFGSACFPVAGRLYVSTISGKLLRLGDDAKTWQQVRDLPSSRFFHRMLPIGGDRLIFLGGASMKTGKFAEVDVVEPSD